MAATRRPRFTVPAHAEPRRPRSGARGSLSAFVVCTVMTMLCLVGLAFDGGRVVATYVQLSDVAQNAARMGDQFVIGIREGSPRIDEAGGRRAVSRYLGARGVEGRAWVSGRTVTVRVGGDVRLVILSLFGVDHRTISVTRSSELISG